MANTLCSLIDFYVSKGYGNDAFRTRIISDKWLGYKPLKLPPYSYKHRSINHLLRFGKGDFNSSHIEGVLIELKLIG